MSRNKYTQFTAEAFRDLAERATSELYENADGPYEVADLKTWTERLKRAVSDTASHEGSGDADVIQRDSA